MFTSRKLKPDRSVFGPIQPVIVLAIFGLTLVFWGIYIALIVLIFIYVLYFLFTMYVFLRVKNYYYIPVALFQLLAAIFFTFNSKGPLYMDQQMFRGIVICMICFMVMAVFILINKKIKWRGREIFELAAQNVEVDPETFTERPKPSGKITYKRDDLFGFAHFYQKHLLGICKREDSTLVFIPVRMNQWANVLYNPAFNYREQSYITIDFDGSVSTFISKKDYLEYKEDLAFDQLTESLSNLHLEFFKLYQSGKEIRILDRLNELNINIFT